MSRLQQNTACTHASATRESCCMHCSHAVSAGGHGSNAHIRPLLQQGTATQPAECSKHTCSLGRMGMSSCAGMFLKLGPSSATPDSVRMPHSRAMWRAVWMLSPVTMRTVMPAFWHTSTACGTSCLQTEPMHNDGAGLSKDHQRHSVQSSPPEPVTHPGARKLRKVQSARRHKLHLYIQGTTVRGVPHRQYTGTQNTVNKPHAAALLLNQPASQPIGRQHLPGGKRH
jgi:hypothetical protein